MARKLGLWPSFWMTLDGVAVKSEEARGRNGFWLDEERWKGINQVDHSHIDGCRQASKGGATPKDLHSAIVMSSDNLAA